jgi:hypothetical protein
LNLPHDRDHIGRALVCAVNNFAYRPLARLTNLWIPERNATNGTFRQLSHRSVTSEIKG